MRAAKAACTVAEYFRDQGKNVLLLMDSLTRLCQAQRQIGLAASEPPATKGFPPSVFPAAGDPGARGEEPDRARSPVFIRCWWKGTISTSRSRTRSKGITDGHLWLSRSLANRGHFPALDVLQSISRVRGDVTSPQRQRQAKRLLALTAVWNDIEDLVNIGAYVPGANPEFDLAVQVRPKILQFLQQDAGSPQTMEQSCKQMEDLTNWIDQLERVIRAQAQKGVPKPAGTAVAGCSGAGEAVTMKIFAGGVLTGDEFLFD